MSKASKESLGAIENGLSQGTPGKPLTETVPTLMLAVFNERAAHGISLSLAAPEKGGSTTMPAIKALAEDVQGTSLKSFGIKIAGTYKSFDDLQQYLQLLSATPAAVQRLKIQEQSFEATLRVYGTLED